MPESDRYWTYFDEAWKHVLERFFPELLQFFLPALARDVDFSTPITFLDKELEQLAQTSLKGAKQVDKLAQVALRDGSEQWVLVHIEVQGDKDDDFSLRMFRYFYRIFDRHGQRVVSMAILTSPERLPSEGRYELTAYGSGVDFRYLPFRLMAYNRVELEQDPNPAALVVLAAQERERLRRSGERFNTKLSLIRKLYERGYSREQIVGLFEFIDWVVQLNEAEDGLFWEAVKAIEEEKRMPYVTTGERIGREQGLQQGLEQGLQQGLQQGLEQGLQQGLGQGLEQGLQQGSLEEGRAMVLEALEEQFGKVPAAVASAIGQITDRARLHQLLRQAIRCRSLEEFQHALDALEQEP